MWLERSPACNRDCQKHGIRSRIEAATNDAGWRASADGGAIGSGTGSVRADVTAADFDAAPFGEAAFSDRTDFFFMAAAAWWPDRSSKAGSTCQSVREARIAPAIPCIPDIDPPV